MAGLSRRQLLRGGAALTVAGAATATGLTAFAPPAHADHCGLDPSKLADNEIPSVAYHAYRAAATGTVTWTVLAAIGSVESRHQPDAIGPALDGGPGVRAIPASDYGTRLHGDPRWEHAVGMMQFLPTTFRRHRPSAIASPLDPADAAAAAASFLQASGAATNLRQALHAYNNSWPYVNRVLAKADAYYANAVIVACQPRYRGRRG